MGQKFNNVIYHRDELVATITFNRPNKLNAVVPGLIDDFNCALDQVEKDGVRVVLLKGSGRAFCAGYDLTASHESQGGMKRSTEQIQNITRKMRLSGCIFVAAVHGYALGAGCEFALCSDLVIAAEDAMFGFPEVEVGLSVTGGISALLPLAVGAVKAKELLLLGEHFSAEVAKSFGLINRVVASADLDEVADDWARLLIKRPAIALSHAKELVDFSIGATMEQALAREVDIARLSHTTGEEELGRRNFRTRSHDASTKD